MIKAMLLLLVVLFLFAPSLTFASDSHIPSVSLAITDQAPSALADYIVTFSTDFGVGSGGGMVIRFFPVDAEGTIGDNTTAGFDFSNATFSSDTIQATGSVVAGGSEYSLVFTSAVTAGEKTFTLSGIGNTATEGDYTLGLSVTMSPTTDDFTTAPTFTISTDPCVSITTTEFESVSAASFGTNVVIGRNTPTDTTVVTYTLAYATTQEEIDNNTATRLDITTNISTTVSNLIAQTTYYFQVQALDVNSCIVQQSNVTATTEKAIANQKYSKPTIKKIKTTSAVTSWTNDDYAETYAVQLWSKGGKKLHTYKNITGLKQLLTKKYLKPGKSYKVRVRAIYTTGETTRWSKFYEFKTRS